MLPGSIRLKITLSFMALLTIMMLLFSLVLYDRLFSDLYSNIDNLLETRAGGIADAIDTYWELEKQDARTDGGPADSLRKADNLNFIKIARRWVTEESSSPELLNIIVQIFDAKGNLIASSKNIARTIVFPKKIFDDALSGTQRFGTFSAPFSPKKPTALRVLTKPVSEDGIITYIVQVASPLTAIHTALEDLKGLLTVLLPLMILCTGVIGLFLAKIALRPVDRMTRAVRQITGKNLKLRVPVPRPRDEMQSLAVTFNDMLERLEKAFASQRRFLQDASHELKTPLTILEGEIGVALQRTRPAEEYEAILRSSIEEIDRLNAIVENLLVLSRFEDRETVSGRTECDIGVLLRSTADDVAVLAEQKSISLAVVPPAEPMIVSADKNFLRQVFVNIMDNAIKYTPAGGAVTAEAAIINGAAQITVRDTGIGIPEEEITRIFDRFYRVDASRSSTGFGLGLSIAKSIVEAHGGTITAKSSPAPGAAFTVTLPLKHHN